jgi:sulfate adenylyltransferase subunit 2
MAHLARKAFHPGKLPLPLMHVDTGHNLRETMEFRDRYMQELDATLVVASVQKMIDEGRLEEETGRHASRNGLQIPTLLSAAQWREEAGRELSRIPAIQLDGDRRLALHP